MKNRQIKHTVSGWTILYFDNCEVVKYRADKDSMIIDHDGDLDRLNLTEFVEFLHEVSGLCMKMQLKYANAVVKDKVSISKTEYEKLKHASKKLDALVSAGVDNWEGYGHATSEFYAHEEPYPEEDE